MITLLNKPIRCESRRGENAEWEIVDIIGFVDVSRRCDNSSPGLKAGSVEDFAAIVVVERGEYEGTMYQTFAHNIKGIIINE